MVSAPEPPISVSAALPPVSANLPPSVSAAPFHTMLALLVEALTVKVAVLATVASFVVMSMVAPLLTLMVSMLVSVVAVSVIAAWLAVMLRVSVPARPLMVSLALRTSVALAVIVSSEPVSVGLSAPVVREKLIGVTFAVKLMALIPS